jgi:predicted DNA-binding transcriptional regulator AlpA
MTKNTAPSSADRLGWRINEWTALTRTSRPTIWRQIKDGRLKIIDVNGIKLIPRSEAVRLGLLDAGAR